MGQREETWVVYRVELLVSELGEGKISWRLCIWDMKVPSGELSEKRLEVVMVHRQDVQLGQLGWSSRYAESKA